MPPSSHQPESDRPSRPFGPQRPASPDGEVPAMSEGARTFGQRRRDAEALAEALTPRQREVLAHLLRGDSVKEAAAALGLSQHTINEHTKDLHRHFNVTSRSELLAMFVPTWY